MNPATIVRRRAHVVFNEGDSSDIFEIDDGVADFDAVHKIILGWCGDGLLWRLGSQTGLLPLAADKAIDLLVKPVAKPVLAGVRELGVAPFALQ